MNAPHTRGTAIRSLGVRFGAERRTNDWYAEHTPEALAAVRERALEKAFSLSGTDATSAGFDNPMKRYVGDPFRGAKVRYKLGPGEDSRTLEYDAARDALLAAGIDPDGAPGIDAILVASWLPENWVAPGNAAYLAGRLGTLAPAFNIETACSSGIAGMELAEGLIAVGRYQRVLLVLSNTVSRQAEDSNSLSWISSDVAAAVILEAAPEATIVSSAMENTSSTCDVFVHHLVPGADGPRLEMAVGPKGAKPLRDHSGPELVRRLCGRALDRAGVGIDDLGFFGCSTPLAWFAEICSGALGVPSERVNDLFPRTGNVGLPFPLLHLYLARADGRLRPGELGLLYTIGSTSTVGAMVVRGGEWALGPRPEGL